MGEKRLFTTKGQCRLSYANVWEAKKDDNGKMKYTCMLLIPKSDTETLLQFKEAIEEAYQEDIEVLKGNNKTAPSIGSIHTPLRDGDDERPDDPVFEGMMFVNTSSNYQPQMFDIEKDDITDREQVYSGCWCRARVSMYAYNTKGGKGIAVSLRALQKISDDERLDKKSNMKDFF